MHRNIHELIKILRFISALDAMREERQVLQSNHYI